MAHTVESIQTWIDDYYFVSNKSASQHILTNIVRNMDNHSFVYGPTDNNGYTLSITGPSITHDFIVKADQ